MVAGENQAFSACVVPFFVLLLEAKVHTMHMIQKRRSLFAFRFGKASNATAGRVDWKSAVV